MKVQKLLLLPLFLTFMVNGFSQQFIGKSRKEVLKTLNSYEKRETINTIILEYDSLITFQVRDTSWQHLDQAFYLDGKGICYMEKLQANCDSCFTKYFTQTLKNRKYKWKEIQPGKYVSGFSNSLMLEMEVDASYAYSIKKLTISRKEYKKLKRAGQKP